MNRKKYDRELALKLYQELGTYAAVARKLGCSTGAAIQVVRQAKGFCLRCDNPPLEGHAYCEKHLKQNNKNSRKSIEKRRQSGLCVRCGKPLNRNGVVCSECSKSTSSATMARGKERMKQGLCFNCGQPRSPRSEWLCDTCLDKVRNRTDARYQALKSAGICTSCGKNPVSKENSILCDSCREKNLKRRRLGTGDSEYALIWQFVMDKYDSKCYLCGKPAETVHHIDESNYTDEPNHNIDNLVPLCKACHAGITSMLSLARRSDIVKVLKLISASPTNNIVWNAELLNLLCH